jgi:hypothetical protein
MGGDRIPDFIYEPLKAVRGQRDALLCQAVSHTGALLVVEPKLNCSIDRHSRGLA